MLIPQLMIEIRRLRAATTSATGRNFWMRRMERSLLGIGLLSVSPAGRIIARLKLSASATFIHHILHVLFLGSVPKVARIDTIANVAGMADNLSFRNRPENEPGSNTMCSYSTPDLGASFGGRWQPASIGI